MEEAPDTDVQSAGYLGLRVQMRAGDEWVTGLVTEFDTESGRHLVQHDDGSTAWYDLAASEVRLMHDAAGLAAVGDLPGKDGTVSVHGEATESAKQEEAAGAAGVARALSFGSAGGAKADRTAGSGDADDGEMDHADRSHVKAAAGAAATDDAELPRRATFGSEADTPDKSCVNESDEERNSARSGSEPQRSAAAHSVKRAPSSTASSARSSSTRPDLALRHPAASSEGAAGAEGEEEEQEEEKEEADGQRRVPPPAGTSPHAARLAEMRMRLRRMQQEKLELDAADAMQEAVDSMVAETGRQEARAAEADGRIHTAIFSGMLAAPLRVAAVNSGSSSSMEAMPSGAARDQKSHAELRAASPTNSSAAASRMTTARRDEVLDAEEQLFSAVAPVPVPPRPRVAEEAQRLRDQVAATQVPRYAEQFEELVPAAEIRVGVVSVEDIELQEEAMERARQQAAEEQAREFAQREHSLAVREAAARRRVVVEVQHQQSRVRVREAQAVERERERERGIHRAFARAEERMKTVLARQKAVVREAYGELEPVTQSAARRFKVEWRGLPQPVEVRFDMVRAVKDKLPPGKYVMLCQLYDRLGGQPLTWNAIGGQSFGFNRPGATRPVRHRGRFFDVEMRFGQSVFAVCPARWRTRPSMVFVFELFLLGGKRHPVDKVVAWSAMPMADADFDVAQGCFRLPMLKGELDPEVDRFDALEGAYSHDLDRWLANLYLEVRHLPRETLADDGSIRREYDVELGYTQRLLGLRRGDREGESASDSDSDGANASDADEEEKQEHALAPPAEWAAGGAPRAEEARSELPTLRDLRRQAQQAAAPVVPHFTRSAGGGTELAGLSEDGAAEDAPLLPRAGSGSKQAGGGSGAPTASDSAVRLLGRGTWDGASAAEGGEGDDARAVLADATASRAQRQYALARLLDPGALAEYQYAVSRRDKLGVAQDTEASRRLNYLRHEVLADLGLSRWYTLEFWITVLVLLIASWLRLYSHYLGQWLFLRGNRVPVYDFRVYAHTCIVKFVSEAVPAEVEVGAVIAGPLFNVGCMFGLMLIAWASRFLAGRFPDTGSRFVSCFSIAVVLDPLLVLLVDILSENFNCRSRAACAQDMAAAACMCTEGDAFKLYFRFLREEGSGVVGIFLTLFLYISVLVLSLFLLYLYMLHVHMNGRMLDVYRRLHSPDDAFFVPHDYEVSVEEIKWVCGKAARWRGPNGAQRRVGVCDYVLTNPLDPSFREVSTHLALYTQELNGARKLYRHFLRMPDGTALELFGDMAERIGAKYDVLEQLLHSSAEDAAGSMGLQAFFAGVQEAAATSPAAEAAPREGQSVPRPLGTSIWGNALPQYEAGERAEWKEA